MESGHGRYTAEGGSVYEGIFVNARLMGDPVTKSCNPPAGIAGYSVKNRLAEEQIEKMAEDPEQFADEDGASAELPCSSSGSVAASMQAGSSSSRRCRRLAARSALETRCREALARVAQLEDALAASHGGPRGEAAGHGQDEPSSQVAVGRAQHVAVGTDDVWFAPEVSELDALGIVVDALRKLKVDLDGLAERAHRAEARADALFGQLFAQSLAMEQRITRLSAAANSAGDPVGKCDRFDTLEASLLLELDKREASLVRMFKGLEAQLWRQQEFEPAPAFSAVSAAFSASDAPKDAVPAVAVSEAGCVGCGAGSPARRPSGQQSGQQLAQSAPGRGALAWLDERFTGGDEPEFDELSGARTRQASGLGIAPPRSSVRLQVGGLVGELANIVEKELEKLFSPFGEIVLVDIPRDSYAQKSEGHAFVQFKDASDALDARVCMNGFRLAGQELKIDIVDDPGSQAAPGLFGDPIDRLVRTLEPGASCGSGETPEEVAPAAAAAAARAGAAATAVAAADLSKNVELNDGSTDFVAGRQAGSRLLTSDSLFEGGHD